MKNKYKLNNLIRFFPAVFIVSVSFYLSSQPKIQHMPQFWNGDKLIHFICFGGLAFWTAFGFNIKNFRSVWIPVLTVSLYGIIDELHQHFTPGRSCDLFDWICDTAGAFFGACAYFIIIKIVLSKYRKL